MTVSIEVCETPPLVAVTVTRYVPGAVRSGTETSIISEAVPFGSKLTMELLSDAVGCEGDRLAAKLPGLI